LLLIIHSLNVLIYLKTFGHVQAEMLAELPDLNAVDDDIQREPVVQVHVHVVSLMKQLCHKK